MSWFSIRMASGDSITVDGEFTIADNGVLTVVRTQYPQQPANTTHFSPAAWVSVEVLVQQPRGIPVGSAQLVG
ncbi:hypothetical protein [Mycobacterium talmoniae]|uniref:Uncharacterized protein n=2 Tax=Mycobacterium talmoniae TaxID=1858794 RepID=A0A2S8BHV2_9MYCO|nr:MULTISPECIES: hypothetical protein [Mycobacterium]PQM46257.1 hypothetical protein C1Y40_03577 [Mycobacterium talmoniae]TDH48530.1 hypothetical protein E2F47_23435 [Mycobacterium eburneum]